MDDQTNTTTSGQSERPIPETFRLGSRWLSPTASRLSSMSTVILPAAVIATSIAFGLVASKPAGGVTVTTVDRTVNQAVSYAKSTGVSAAVVVLDDETGKLYSAGNYTSNYGSASVMKLFVATKLLATGQMSNSWIAGKAWSMITRSDDDALNALLPYVGGVGVINWVKSYYGISFLGTTPYKAGCWGNTQITAKGIAYFYRRMKHDGRVAPWLVNALHHYQGYAADGTNQTFGIPQAASGVGVKQGWGHCSSNTNGSVIHSTRLVGSNRFAVAILTNTNNWSVNAHSYNATQASVVTKMAKILMPHGYVDLPEAHNPFGHVDSVSAKGSTVTITGWGLDPDIRTGSVTVRVSEGSYIRWQQKTSIYRADVNSAYHTTGNHGYRARFTAPNGAHVYCVHLLNYGMGNASPYSCYRIAVNGSPVGRLSSVSAPTPGQLTVSGWAYDPDVVPNPSYVKVSIDAGTSAAASSTLLANQTRPNGTYNVAGNHGFGAAIPATPGSHRVCVSALNAGPPGPAPVSLGCASITVQPVATPTPTPTSSPPPNPTDTPTTDTPPSTPAAAVKADRRPPGPRP
jgi:hypothetical protein